MHLLILACFVFCKHLYEWVSRPDSLCCVYHHGISLSVHAMVGYMTSMDNTCASEWFEENVYSCYSFLSLLYVSPYFFIM